MGMQRGFRGRVGPREKAWPCVREEPASVTGRRCPVSGDWRQGSWMETIRYVEGLGVSV